MGSFGFPELLIILLIIIVLFGASRLAGVGAALGKSVSEFRKGVKEDDTSTTSTTAGTRSEDVRNSPR